MAVDDERGIDGPAAERLGSFRWNVEDEAGATSAEVREALEGTEQDTAAGVLEVQDKTAFVVAGAGVQVVKHGNRALQAGDTKANAYYVVVYDGTNYVLQTPTEQPVIMAMANFDGTASTPITPCSTGSPMARADSSASVRSLRE